MSNPPLSPPVFHVLLALGENTLHGYAIRARFEELTGRGDLLLPGTLYATLARMTEAGLIQDVPAPRGDASGGPPRRHYRITAAGRAAAAAEGERMRLLVEVARRQSLTPRPAR
jgi:DNA-binding PadR family transcriptional regulator